MSARRSFARSGRRRLALRSPPRCRPGQRDCPTPRPTPTPPDSVADLPAAYALRDAHADANSVADLPARSALRDADANSDSDAVLPAGSPLPDADAYADAHADFDADLAGEAVLHAGRQLPAPAHDAAGDPAVLPGAPDLLPSHPIYPRYRYYPWHPLGVRPGMSGYPVERRFDEFPASPGRNASMAATPTVACPTRDRSERAA